jgi:2-iminobutanoate/2-iminopropanoate deaminase
MGPQRTTIDTDRAPKAIGPYSQAVVAGGLVWVSGQIPLDPASGVIVDGDVGLQARRALDNLSRVLEAAGSSLDRVVRTTIYLADLGDFEQVNRVYAEYFVQEPPARACVEVSGLPKGARVEIDAVALS